MHRRPSFGSPSHWLRSGIAFGVVSILLAAPLPARSAAAPGVDLAPDPFTPSVKVWVKNPTKQPISGRVTLSNPDNFLGAARAGLAITVPPGGEEVARFALPGAAMVPDSRYNFTVELDAGSAKGTHSRLLSFFKIEQMRKTPAFDGTMDGWLNASMILINIPGRFPGQPGWKGAADLYATARFLWDEQNFYVMVRRTDDVFTPAPSLASDAGDRVRVAISPTGSHREGASWVTVDLVPLASGGAGVTRKSHASLKLKDGPVPGARAAVPEHEGVKVFLASIPWTELGITKGKVTRRLGLTVRSIDDDGDGPKSWLEWGNGADLPTPDPTAFSDVSLGE